MFTKSQKEFLNYVKKRCKKAGVKIYFGKGKKILCDGVKVSGYFDDVNKVLAVALGGECPFEILVHEFGHFTQWVDQCPAWVKSENFNAYNKFWDYVNGKPVKDGKRALSLVREVELDCESRAVDLILCHGLNIDVDFYIKRSNAYVFFYNWMKYTKKWCKPNNTPYNNKRLVHAMPSVFLDDYRKIPDNLLKIFKEENI